MAQYGSPIRATASGQLMKAVRRRARSEAATCIALTRATARCASSSMTSDALTGSPFRPTKRFSTSQTQAFGRIPSGRTNKQRPIRSGLVQAGFATRATLELLPTTKLQDKTGLAHPETTCHVDSLSSHIASFLRQQKSYYPSNIFRLPKTPQRN
jgi:hypothetical protein